MDLPRPRRGAGRPTASDVPRRLRRAARELLVERGYDDLRVRDIAEAAGVSTATMYKHIDGLDQLLVDIYWEQFRDWLVHEVRSVHDAAAPPLRAAATHAATLAARHPNLLAGMVRALLSADAAVKEHRVVIDRVLHEGIMQMLGEAADPLTAHIVAAAWRGAFIDWALGSTDDEQLGQVLIGVASLVEGRAGD